ncbi:glycosyltransferase family 2 protein [Labilibacter sediminis]|nr:glycosyltransferase family 2 protein [Labilibacter sediminis]
MLSVCIPLYNFDVTPLVKKLVEQSQQNFLTIEIMVFDDGSTHSYKELNRSIKEYKEVVYLELEKNLGSAAIRNKLASEAKYDKILFLDSDSDIHPAFIKNYLPFLSEDHSIVYGGRVHPKELPSFDKSLRWKVGKIKEDHNAAQRSKVPNKSFMSNNFLVQKELFKRIAFDETIERSGHEDTMYGIELELKGIKIVHIDNPVVHIGLESNDEFISKTKQRLETLKFLSDKHKDNHLLDKRITILKYFNLAKSFKLISLFSVMYKLTQKAIEKNLCTKNPSMLLYDLYKLGYYSKLTKQNS